jgi:putative tryptophan/tyrosine transport system substrate-binding protein
MQRRSLLSGIAASLAAPSVLAQPASTRAAPLVGVLITTSLTQGLNAQTVAILRQELSRSGYVDGQTLRLDIQSGGGAPEKLAGLAKDLVAREAAVLCAFGPAAVRAARAATGTVPIVALDLETDPVREGWVRTLSRPGTNVTGLFLDLSVLTGKWLELLRAAVPRMRKVAVLWDSSTGTGQLDAMANATASMAMEPHVLRFANATDLDRLLEEGHRDGVDAMSMLSSPIVRNASRQLADYAKQMKLPAISPFAPFAEFGGLMAYGPDLTNFFRRSAAFVSKILSGAAPSEIPIEQPTKFEMVVNLKAANALGLTPSRELLLSADKLLE